MVAKLAKKLMQAAAISDDPEKAYAELAHAFDWAYQEALYKRDVSRIGRRIKEQREEEGK